MTSKAFRFSGQRRGAGARDSRAQSGFTLVEIAIVLVIIGLLIGSILKGQEMINSARVRNLADMTTQTTAAYFGFVDRYRQVPGDWSAANATVAIGVPISLGGNEDGAIDHTLSAWTEPTALWEQLAAAGFIQGAYVASAVEPAAGSGAAPENAYNGLIFVARTNDYLQRGTPSPPARRHVVLGHFVPVDIMQEVDTKLDDGVPDRGDLRITLQDATVLSGANDWGGYGATACTAAPAGQLVWDVATDSQDCNGVFLF